MADRLRGIHLVEKIVMRKPLAHRQYTVLQRQVKAHARFLTAVAAGIVVWFAARDFLAVTRFLIAWNAGVWLFLALVLKMMATATIADLRKRASLEEEGRVATLILVTVATIAALIALGVELSDALQAKAPNQSLRIAIAIAAIFGSWLFVNFSFALHYAHEVYRTKLSINALNFPNEKEPDYWDFLYFALVLGTTFQTSDVEIRSRILRRTAMVQGLVAFLFNTAIIALTVSVASKLVGG
ncbi:MAG: DUF1345 domain-containing protein [Xanthobacteraceae bacterium]|nr:DUF1345 domain-containing protein [Xanthobacteraceae bacterium]